MCLCVCVLEFCALRLYSLVLAGGKAYIGPGFAGLTMGVSLLVESGGVLYLNSANLTCESVLRHSPLWS